MTTARETIITGLQALKVLGFGQSPTSAQGEYCLRQLNAYIRQLVGFSGSLPLQNIRVTSAYQVCNRWPAIRLNAATRYTLFGQRLSPDDYLLADKGAKRIRARYAKPPTAVFDPAVSGVGGRTPGSVAGSLSDFLNGVDY